MKISNVGCNYHHSVNFYINRPYGSGDYMLLIIKSEAFISLNEKRIIVSPNSAIIFKKGTPQFYGALNSEYINDWVHFDLDEQEKSFISNLGIEFDTIIPLSNVAEFAGLLKNIFFELYSHNIHKDASMKRYFELTLLKLAENINQHHPEHEHPYYDTFCKLRNEIQLTPQKRWSIDEICKKTYLSRSYVQHLYKHFFNTNILTDIQNYRMEYAKYLLSATDMTITVISQSCGYDNDVHFMRTFKKATTMTPSKYRSKFHVSSNEIQTSKDRPPFSIKTQNINL